MKKIEITFRDLYQEGTDTVILIGGVAETFLISKDQNAFLTKLETVSFTHPYIIKFETEEI